MQLSFSILKSKFVGTIDNPNDSICLLEIISPIRTNSSLTSHIPNIQFIALVLQRFDIESECWRYLIDILSIELFDYGCFASIVQT